MNVWVILYGITIYSSLHLLLSRTTGLLVASLLPAYSAVQIVLH